MTNIEIVLLDADGVIQTDASHRQEALDYISGDPEKTAEMWEEIWDAEFPCLFGKDDFPTRLDEVLNRWGNRVSRTEALAVWNAIQPNSEVLEFVSSIRATGIPVVLTSSQEASRAKYMAEELRYESYFDRLFFSCDVGYMKPATSYFTQVLSAFSVSPNQALFVDDNKKIVEGAEEFGLIARQFDLNNEPVEKLFDIFSDQGLL